MKICDRTCCSFPKWYPLFKKHTFRSVIEEVPVLVLSYLKEDGVVLPVEAVSSKKSSQGKSNLFDSSFDDSCDVVECSGVSTSGKTESVVEVIIDLFIVSTQISLCLILFELILFSICRLGCL